MDASDVIRKLKAQTNFNFYAAKLAVTQPGVNINVNTDVSTIKIGYPSYEERNDIALGKWYVGGQSTIGIAPIANTGNKRVITQWPKAGDPVL